MERRRAKRRPRRVQVRVFGADGGQHLGFTTNISQTGMFVAMNHVHAPGARVRVEVLDRDRSIVMEAVVARALQVPAMFRGLEHQGIGLRFLRPDELLGGLLQDGTRPVSAPSVEPLPIDALGAGVPHFEVSPLIEEPHGNGAAPAKADPWAAAAETAATAVTEPPGRGPFKDPWARPASNGRDSSAQPQPRGPSQPQSRARGTSSPAPQPALRGTLPQSSAESTPTASSRGNEGPQEARAAVASTRSSDPVGPIAPRPPNPAALSTAAPKRSEPVQYGPAVRAPSAPRLQPAPNGGAASPAEGFGLSAAAHMDASSSAFVVSFATRDELRARLAAEIQYGGIFVRHSSPPEVGGSVHVQLTLLDPPLVERLEARVIHRSDGSVSIAGFAVEFVDSMGVVARIRRMLK